MELFLVGLLFISIPFSNAILFGDGKCPDVETVSDFKPQEFYGKWYENRKYLTTLESVSLDEHCVSLYLHTVPPIKDLVRVYRTSRISSNDSYSSVPFANITVNGDEKNGKFNLALYSDAGTVKPLWILGTDYESFAVAWNCLSFSTGHEQNAWILTREKHPPLSVITKALKVLETNHLNTDRLFVTQKDDCKY